MGAPGKLYLLPVPIAEGKTEWSIPAHNFEVIRSLKFFIAEDAKTARRCLKQFGYAPIENAEILLLNEHSKAEDIQSLIKPLLDGHDTGLMSDAGCPGIADPGADMVKLAHQKNIEVVPMVGPSSIVLSIMASGFNGQNFAFVGYLPIDKGQKAKRLKELEQLVVRQKQAQFFIETPYRNEQLFDTLLETLSAQTFVFVGKDITSANQYLVSKTVGEWRKAKKPEMNKVPVVFGIYS